MTDDNAKGKLTLSPKSTLTLKNPAKSGMADGKKMVQVEVRKKRTISTTGEIKTPKVEIDEATAQKLRLIAEAKEELSDLLDEITKDFNEIITDEYEENVIKFSSITNLFAVSLSFQKEVPLRCFCRILNKAFFLYQAGK